MVLVVLLAVLIVFVVFCALVVLALLRGLLWIVSFASPLGHRVQMERVLGKGALAMQRPGRAALDEYEAETRRMIQAAVIARRAKRAGANRRP